MFTYQCKKCGEKFEVLVGVSSHSEEIKCKACGSKEVERIFSSFGVKASSTSSISCPTGTCPLS